MRFKRDVACESSSYLADNTPLVHFFWFIQAQWMLKLASQLENADWLIVDAQ